MAEHYIIDGKEHVYESAAEKHLTDKTITQNGTYSAEDEPGDINGYKNVTVDVEGGGGQTEIPVEDYVIDYSITQYSNAVKSGGFKFSLSKAIKVTKIRVFPRASITVNVHISNDVGVDYASVMNADVIGGQWNDIELDEPVILSPANFDYVVWCSHNDGTTLGYTQNISSALPFVVYKYGMYSIASNTFPSNEENYSVYGVDIYVESVIEGSILVEKTITENGTYNPSDDNADGYSQVSVNVPHRPLIGTTIPSNSQGSNGDTYIYGNEVVPTGLGWAANEAYLVEDANELLATVSGRPYYKTNDGMAIGVFLKARDYAGPVLISSDPTYAYYTYNSSGTNYNKTIDGITMYMSTFNDWYGSYSVPSDGVLKDCVLEVNYNASRSADYEGIFDAILEATAFTVGNGGIVCRDIYYKESGVWKTSGFIIDTN